MYIDMAKKNHRRILYRLFFIYLVFFPHITRAFDSYLNSSRYRGMAGAGIAATSKVGMEDFGLVNPAILSTNADLLFTGGYVKGQMADQDLSGFSVSIMDSVNGAWDSKRSELLPQGGFPLASVLYYSNLNYGQIKDQYFQLGVAQPLKHNMSLGLSVNYSILKSDGLNVSENVWDFGAGFLWKLHPRWALGVTAVHLLDNRTEHMPGYLRRGLGAGVEFEASTSVKIRGDFWRTREGSNETQSVFKIGVQNFITESLAVQFGYADDRSIDSKILAVGLMILGPKLSLSYSINRQTSYNDLLHSVDIRLPVW